MIRGRLRAGRHRDASHKAALLAELFPEYFNGAGAPGRKKESGHRDPIKGTPEKLAHGEPINTQEAVAKATGLSVNTIKRAKAVHKAATDRATAQGRPAPAPDDYRAAVEGMNKGRRERERGDTVTPFPGQDFPGMIRTDKANKGKGPRPFEVPKTPDNDRAALAAILDRAADRVGTTAPREIAAALVADLIRAGLYALKK